MYYNNPTVISIIEVVLILVPALLAVAYVTVAERKTMASMQRRLGPNVVGQINRFSIFKSQAGFYHTTSHSGRGKIKNNINLFGYATPSSLIHKFSSSLSSPVFTIPLSPEWITGFIDGEGSFGVQIIKSSLYRIGWTARASFKISLHKKDQKVLEAIRNYLGVGNITADGADGIRFQVSSMAGLLILINYLEQYPLITQKHGDFILWREIILIIQRKEHLTLAGLKAIISHRASLNLGISEELKAAFPEILPSERPLIVNQRIRDPQWLAGFTSAEGCFFINIIKSKEVLVGYQVKLKFQVTQHTRDENLMRSIVSYLGCGNLYFVKSRKVTDYCVVKYSDLIEKIIPFFENYPIIGVKSQDFADFCRVALLMKDRKHITLEGLNQIKHIKAGMNKGRCV